jgi:YVTN family beta-propeller protein
VTRTARRPLRGLASLLAAAALLSACDGGNGFKNPVGSGSGNGGGGNGGAAASDTTAPTLTIEFPRDSAVVAIGDSVFVQVRVADNQRLGSLLLAGFSVRGDRSLGTDSVVARYGTKSVNLAQMTRRDTTITRYLIATADSTPERRVMVVATARDSAGNSRVDTAFVNIGGPRVQIAAPAQNDSFPSAGVMPVRVVAEDVNDLIRTVVVRMTGAFAREIVIPVAVPRAKVDTTVSVAVPSATGALTIEAVATSGSNIQATSRPVAVRITAPVADRTAPQVTFNADTVSRRQGGDTVRVFVLATDETAVDSVGATLRVRYRDPATGATTERFLTARQRASQAEIGIPLGQLGLSPADTVTLSVEVTAWAVDAAGNCGAATSPGTPQRLPCALAGGAHVAAGVSGRLVVILVTRGTTVAFPSAGDTIADIASDGRRVFASNMNANRVEVLPVTGLAFTTPVSVGSRPWGLAVGATGDSLLVANSGGTNISVVALPATGTPQEVRRIRTADVELYDVSYDVKTDSVSRVVVGRYSDRPQFLGQLSTGQILYSTRPTAAGVEGTIRVYDRRKDTSYEFNRGTEIFTNYATRTIGKGIVVNALDAGLSPGSTITVCPRRLRPEQNDPSCVNGLATAVSVALTNMRNAGATDTRLDLGVDAGTIGLSDTTFVATSTQRNAIAFGEGVREFGRILYFQLQGGNLVGSSRESSDLIQNAADRVIGLGLNSDGSLGVARGNQVYFFDSSLRLAGVTRSGSPTGGSAMHPLNTGYPSNDGRRLGFTSGVDASGPYIDIIDTYSFETIRRLPVRDRVTGTVIAIPVLPGDPEAALLYTIRLFALTPSGILRIGLTPADLRR